MKRTAPDARDVAALAASLTFKDIEAAARRLVTLATADDADAGDLLTVLAALAYSREPGLADALYLAARVWAMPFISPANEAADAFVRDAIRGARGK